MKKYLSLSFGILAVLVLTVSCNQKIDPQTPVNSSDNGAGQTITISASLADLSTKVSGVPQTSGGKISSLDLSWDITDKLLIADKDNASNNATFDLDSGSISADGKMASFTGSLPSGASAYNITVVDGKNDSGLSIQTQPSDGVASVKYQAQALNVAPEDLNSFSLDHLSGVIAFAIKMPSTEAAAEVMSISVKASDDIFYGGNELTLKFAEAGDAGNDGYLHFFATLLSNVSINAGTSLLVHINALSSSTHVVYTRYLEMGATTFETGRVNSININAFNSGSFANASTADIGTSTNPYLIGDKYQLLAVDGLMAAGATKYFKLVDNIDMTGETWALLNNPSPYDRLIDFDGNSKTISNLGGTMFYVFKGAIRNLTLDKPTITGGNKKGALAQFIQGTGNVITNVDIKNVAGFAASTGPGGGLVGLINNGTAGVVSATITNCDIINVPVTCAAAGGLIGQIEAKVEVSDCSYSGNTVTGTTQYVGGLVGNIVTNDLGCTFTGCRVENATIDASGIDADARAGGLLGIMRPGVTVKGCQVGTSTTKVALKTAAKKANQTTGDMTKYFLESGGFVGYMTGGTITKDDLDNNCKAYVNVTSANTLGEPLRLGGFVGYINGGTIEYCDAETTMKTKNNGSGDLEGQHIGGFAGVINGGTVDHCTVKTDIRGNNWTAGFAGVGYAGTVTYCDVLTGSIVNGQSGVGGFVGETRDGSIWEHNTTAANVTAKNTNGGGFVGICGGGKLTSNSASGTATAAGPCGGFVGIINANAELEDCSASGNVSSSAGYGGGFAGSISGGPSLKNCYATTGLVSLEGTTAKNFFGGFAGSFADAIADGCYSKGNVTVNGAACEYVGGFIGNVKPGSGKKAEIKNCYAEGDVSAAGRWIGGFIGYIYNTSSACGDVEITKCHATGDVSVSGKSYVAAFIGRTYMVDGSTLTIEKCYATGKVTSNQTYASAFIGEIGEATNCTINDCYSTGGFSGSNQIRGGFIAQVNANAKTSLTISRCYSTSAVTGGFRMGGLIGNIAGTNCTMEDCAAWNSEVTASSAAQTNWSSGAVVGTTHPNCHISNTFRNPSMSLTVYCPPPSADWDHPDINGTTTPLYQNSQTAPFTWAYTTATAISAGSSNVDAGRWAYHGKHVASGTTLSTLASTAKASGGLGWSSDIWDFSGPLPLLK